jgi:uncharacterized protein YhaN
MKIVSMHIYGYGQLENIKIDSLSDFQVFFGENEAGKSTLMSFINSILFGFPTKQQNELRYEPKHSTRYGGNIRIYHEKHGYAVIERVKGKAAGDVKVVLDSGKVGGEELLSFLLGNFDKSLYQAIFSFNLQGLQNIHQMKGEDLGRFLFSAGTLGTEKLAKTELELQKELDLRFKPGGRKPILNEKLQKVHEISQDLKKAAAKLKDYEMLIQKRGQLQQEMAEINKQLENKNIQAEKLKEWKRIESIAKEEKWTKKELETLGEIEFPVRGLERLEKLNQLILPLEAELKSLSERIRLVREEVGELNPDCDLLKEEQVILTLLDQVPLYEQLTVEKGQYESKLTTVQTELSAIQEKLHLPLNEEEIQSINTNISMKNEAVNLSRQGEKLADVKEELDILHQQELNELEALEREVRLTESLCLPEIERSQLEQQLRNHDKTALEEELKNIKEQIQFNQLLIEQEKAANGKLRLQFITIELILVIQTLYGMISKQWVLLFIGLAGCLILGFFMFQSLKNVKEIKILNDLNKLREKEKQVIEILQTASYQDIRSLEEKLKLDDQHRNKLQILKLKLKQQKANYKKIIVKFEEWESDFANYKEKLLSIGKELKIPEQMANTFLLEAFEQIEQYKAFIREKNQLIERISKIHQKQARLMEELTHYGSRYLSEGALDIHKTSYLLRNKLKTENEKRIKMEERKAKIADLVSEYQQKEREWQSLKMEHDRLLNEANAETVSQFYELGEKAEKRADLIKRLENLKKQLQYSILSEQERENFLAIRNCDELIFDCQKEIDFLRNQWKELQEEQARVQYEIQIIEDGGIYSDILHHYKQKKYELEEMAKEWGVYALAQNILTKTIEKYKNKHLPLLLSKAEEFLYFLTNGNYYRIHLHPSGSGFLVERKDQTLFEADELSQATTEQLYVSIRLALMVTIYQNYKFPIVIDDSFVNFDARRTKLVFKLLHKLKQNQILFFTCHEHLLSFLPNENILRLEKGAVQIVS